MFLPVHQSQIIQSQPDLKNSFPFILNQTSVQRNQNKAFKILTLEERKANFAQIENYTKLLMNETYQPITEVFLLKAKLKEIESCFQMKKNENQKLENKNKNLSKEMRKLIEQNHHLEKEQEKMLSTKRKHQEDYQNLYKDCQNKNSEIKRLKNSVQKQEQTIQKFHPMKNQKLKSNEDLNLWKRLWKAEAEKEDTEKQLKLAYQEIEKLKNNRCYE